MFELDTFSKNLITNRNKLEMKAKDLAIAADLTASYLSGIESGRQKPSIKTVINILNVFDLTYKEFMTGTKSITKREHLHKEINGKIQNLSKAEIDFLVKIAMDI